MNRPNDVPPPRTSRLRVDPVAIAVLALCVGIALVAVALAGAGPSSARGSGDGDAKPPPAKAKSPLKRFGSCAQLGGYARRHAEAVSILRSDGIAADAAGVTGDMAAPSAEAGSAPSADSPTNVQEQGVDEPDLVKVSGTTIFAITDNRLEAVDGGPAGPAVLGAVDLPGGAGEDAYAWGQQLLIVGNRALTISNTDLGREPWTRTIISEIDISDPAAMRVVRTLSFDGSYVSARQTGGTVRVVSSTSPSYPFAGEPVPMADLPSASPRPHGARRWLPQARLRDRASGELTREPLVACDQIRKPRRFSGLEMLSVLTIDLEQGLAPVDADSVMTTGQVVYGSPQALYVATERWHDPVEPQALGSQVTTAIHKFQITDSQETDYVASGRVPGFMLSQWSMSESEGLLRVASTTSPPWDESGRAQKSESFVSVLGQSGDRLVEVGRVGGLGSDERIYAVRFIGEVGYVVTFRQVDPLYTIDLSDPAAPRVLGELKIPGYSAYLHPTGPGRLLGIGQDADADGRTLGVQASLFDVADLTAPTRLASAGFGRGSSSEVEYDHHAFLYSEAERLVVIPLEIWSDPDEEFFGAVAFRIDPAGEFEPAVRLSHGDSWRSAIRRSLVLGDRLFTVSARGVMAHDLATLEGRGWAEFVR